MGMDGIVPLLRKEENNGICISLADSVVVTKCRKGLVIAQSLHGFVCAPKYERATAVPPSSTAL